MPASSSAKRRFIRGSLFFRLFTVFAALAVIPVAFISFITIEMTASMVREQLIESRYVSVRYLRSYVGFLIDQVVSLASLYDNDHNLRIVLEREYHDEYERFSEAYRVEQRLQAQSFSFDWMKKQLVLLGVNGSVYSTEDRFVEFAFADFKASYLYAAALRNPERILWLPTSTLAERFGWSEPSFTAVKLLVHPYTRREYGVLFMHIAESTLFEAYRKFLSEEDELVLIDRTGRIVTASDRSLVGGPLDPGLSGNILSAGRGKASFESGGRLYVTERIEEADWTVAESMPLSAFPRRMTASTGRIVLVALALVVIAGLLSFGMARRISTPLHNLARQAHALRFSDGREEDPGFARDELRTMFEDYHLVVDRLRSVIAQLVEEREKRRQSDLTALRTQIRPHFLYNTLNSIKYLVYTGRAERISATVNSLIRILESALDVERDFVPLSEELAVIRDFIVIQEIRMDQALSVHLHVPEACRSCLVPRLSLQPLVENAVFHGIQPDPVGKAIWIRASLIEAGLSIEVIDNGRGMAEAEDELLDDGPGRSASHGLGLRNVRERLRLIYGESARVEIRSAPGSGTSVRISLPARLEESGS